MSWLLSELSMQYMLVDDKILISSGIIFTEMEKEISVKMLVKLTRQCVLTC